MANSKWNKIPLKKLCTRIGDGIHGTPEYVENSNVFFINGNNLKAGNIVITKDTKQVTEIELENNYIELNKNSLLLSINGTLGSMAFYNNESVMLGKSAAYLNFKSDINRFYYYYFQLKGVQEYFYNVATGSTIKNLALKSIQDFEVPYPEKREWKPIAKVLSDLDAKIEFNNKINQELEAMSKTLYDYWFVQFDFPNEQGKPYKSSGGKMVYNKELKRDIPEGWEVGTLLDIANITTGKLDSNAEVIGGKFPFYTCASEPTTIDNWAYDNNVILIAGNNAAGNFHINRYKGKFNAYQRTYIVTAKNKKNLEYLYQILKIETILLKKRGQGSQTKFLTIGMLTSIKAYTNTQSLMKRFHSFANPLYEQQQVVKQQNQKLTDLREWLLPMLMNGQVTVEVAVEKLSIAAEPQTEYKKG
jgi:type I restriction enzyme, S subunit